MKHNILSGIIISLLIHLTAAAQPANQFASPEGAFRRIILPVSARTERPFPTGIMVEANQYVFVEVTGRIKVGNFLGSVYADGISLYHPFFTNSKFYNKYQAHHGALMLILNDRAYPCRPILRSDGEDSKYNIGYVTPDYPPEKFVDALDNNGNTLYSYLPGTCIITPTAGMLYLDLNDSNVADNEGQFTVTIYTLSLGNHYARNQFNRCPEREPANNRDCRGTGWEKEPIKSLYYHGFNNAYRGEGVNTGCQCVYDRGELLQAHPHQGTYDFGLWLMRNSADERLRMYTHLVLDVIPNDLYDKQFGQLYRNSVVVPCR